jgi:hypothetical protein
VLAVRRKRPLPPVSGANVAAGPSGRTRSAAVVLVVAAEVEDRSADASSAVESAVESSVHAEIRSAPVAHRTSSGVTGRRRARWMDDRVVAIGRS